MMRHGPRQLDHTTATEQPLISKSKFLWGSQCLKLLWYAYNAKDQIPPPDAATQAIFDQVLQESLEAVKAS